MRYGEVLQIEGFARIDHLKHVDCVPAADGDVLPRAVNGQVFGNGNGRRQCNCATARKVDCTACRHSGNGLHEPPSGAAGPKQSLTVRVGSGVGVLVLVGVAEAVWVGVGVGVLVSVAVAVRVGVWVGVNVGVCVGVLVGVMSPACCSNAPISQTELTLVRDSPRWRAHPLHSLVSRQLSCTLYSSRHRLPHCRRRAPWFWEEPPLSASALSLGSAARMAAPHEFGTVPPNCRLPPRSL